MNSENVTLKMLIDVRKNVIPNDICNSIIKNIENKEWIKHGWSKINTKESYFLENDDSELDMQQCDAELHQILSPFITKSIIDYNEKYFFELENTKNLITKFSTIRFNRYKKLQMMKQHCDHIISLFDGKERGIPVLSVIMNLNDEYMGGDLYFWKDYKIPLGTGDIVIFPSLFLYPHGVSEVTEGTRYSAVSWVW